MKRIASVIFLIVALGASAAGFDANSRPQNQPSKAKIAGDENNFSEAAILKRAIVSSLAVRSVGENSESAYDQWNDDIANLLMLFERLNSPDDMKTFASLSGYYMGEATGALYACIAMRKGRSFEPYLRQAQNTARAECEERFSDTKVYDGLRNSVCLDLAPFSRSLISDLKSGRTCSDIDSQ